MVALLRSLDVPILILFVAEFPRRHRHQTGCNGEEFSPITNG